MSLSTFQRAVLQEMGIPVWVNQSSLQDENTNPVATGVATGVANNPSADASSRTASNHSSIMPSNEEKQSRLAQLRAQVSSDTSNASAQSASGVPSVVANTSSNSALKAESVNSSSQPASQSSNLPSNPVLNNTPAMIELTQAQRLQGKQWLQDVDVALAYLQLPFTSTQVKIGQDVAVTNGGIVIPSAPHLLTAAMQKQLWKMLCALSSNTCSPESR